MPDPPFGQVNGATTGDPLIPSPTSGSSPRSMIPTFFGHPGRKALGKRPPVPLITYTRPLAKPSTPVVPTAVSDAALAGPALIDPSSPVLTGYSSLVPTMIT